MANVEITNNLPKDLDIGMEQIHNAVDDMSSRLDSAGTMDPTSAHCGHCGHCGHCFCGHCHCHCGHCHCHCARS